MGSRHREFFRGRLESSPAMPVEHHPRWRRIWRPRGEPGPRTVRRAAAIGAGLVGAAVGLALASGSTPTPVTLDADGYRLGSSLLTPAGGGRFVGDAALAIRRDARGATHAASSADIRGRHVVGVCVIDPDVPEETCRFTIGGHGLTATDVRRGHAWYRRYDDGATAVIDGAADVPVPFPVGH